MDRRQIVQSRPSRAGSDQRVPVRSPVARPPASPLLGVDRRHPAATAQLAAAVGNTVFTRSLRSASLIAAGPSAPAVARQARLSRGDANRARAVEARMERISQGASARGAAILAASDTSIADLQESKNHLLAAALNYRTAHDAFTAILKRADAEYESDKFVSDAIQGILVATVLAVLLPEAIATAGTMFVARALVASTSAGLTRAGLVIAGARAATPAAVGRVVDAAAGEALGIGVGEAVDRARTGGRPTDSAALAGPSATERFALVLSHLDGLVDALPMLGAAGNSQRDVGLAASQVSNLAVRLRAGDRVEASVDDLEGKARALEEVDKTGAGAMASIVQMANRMLVLKHQALAVPVEEPAVIEDQLWTRWMASLIGDDANEMLDNDVIEDYLGPGGKGMLDFGRYTFDSDQAEAVTAAQRRWLTSQGIDPGRDSSVTLSKFKAHKRLEEIRRTVVGRTGRLRDPGHIEIDGRIYDYAGNAGPFRAGTWMRALAVLIKRHLQGDVIIDNWTNDHYDVLCNPLEPAPFPAAR